MSEPIQPKKPIFYSMVVGLLAAVIPGLLYGLALRFIFGSDPLHGVFQIISFSYLVLAPVIMGVVSSFTLHRLGVFHRKTYRLASLLIVGVYCGITVLVELETFPCMIILAPAYLALSFLGSWLYTSIAFRNKFSSTKILSLFLISPFLLAPLESKLDFSEERFWVHTETVMEVNREKVWDQILNVSEIQEEELPFTFSHQVLGLPKPLSAHFHSNHGAPVREIRWHQNVHFHEYVTEIHPQNYLAYNVEIDPTSANAIRELDVHVVIGDRYFDVTRGHYQLIPMSPDQTKVILASEYRIKTPFNFYGSWWARFVLNEFHEVILEVMKNRLEKNESL